MSNDSVRAEGRVRVGDPAIRVGDPAANAASAASQDGHPESGAPIAEAPIADHAEADREQRILAAVIHLLAQRGISGVSIRAVAKQADVSLGLVNYYYGDKVGLVASALRHIEELDAALVDRDPTLSPRENLLAALHRIAAPELLTTDYLALRLQLWSLARAHDTFAQINATAQVSYRSGLAGLIHAAQPELSPQEAARRAADVAVVQNGMWLSALLGADEGSLARALDRCIDIALGG